MIEVGSRVQHINADVDKAKGVMQVFEIKNGYAVCGYRDFERLGQGSETYPISELKISE